MGHANAALPGSVVFSRYTMVAPTGAPHGLKCAALRAKEVISRILLRWVLLPRPNMRNKKGLRIPSQM